MFRKRIETKEAEDCDPYKQAWNCAVIVLGENVPHSKHSLISYYVVNKKATSRVLLFKLKLNKIK